MGNSTTSLELDDVVIVINDVIRVLLTGGGSMDRSAYTAALEGEQDIDVVATLPQDEDPVGRIADCAPQVAVILFDGYSQVDLCKRLSIHHPPVGVVLADDFRSALDFAPYREADVRGFVHRDSPMPVLFDAVRAVASGEDFLDVGIPDKPEDPYGLTDRELDVLSLLNFRLSNREIADRLFITRNTVKDHLQNIYGKLGVHNREDAREVAVHAGLIQDLRRHP